MRRAPVRLRYGGLTDQLRWHAVRGRGAVTLCNRRPESEWDISLDTPERRICARCALALRRHEPRA